MIHFLKNKKKLRLFILTAQKNKCWYCNDPLEEYNATLDHIIPAQNLTKEEYYRCVGNNARNFVVACHACNSLKANFGLYEFKANLWIMLQDRSIKTGKKKLLTMWKNTDHLINLRNIKRP